MNMILDIGRSLVSPGFYRKVTTRGLGRAFGHIFLVVLLYSIAFSIYSHRTVLKEAIAFLDWAGEKLPVLTLSGREITSDAQEPYFASYRDGVMQLVFSTKEPYADLASLPQGTIVIEKERAIFVGEDQVLEEYVYADAAGSIPENVNLRVDEAAWSRIKSVLKSYFSPVVFVLTFLFSVFGYLLAALLYSLIGVVLNLIFGAKLAYEKTLSICIYALTFLNLFVILSLFIPFLNFPFRIILLIGATVCYIAMGMIVNRPGSHEA